MLMVSQCLDLESHLMRKVLEKVIVDRTTLYILHHPFATMVVETYFVRVTLCFCFPAYLSAFILSHESGIR